MTDAPKVMLLGADGFIGRHIAFALRDQGMRVVCVARRTKALESMGFQTLAVDFTRELFQTPDFWQLHLQDVDYVVNAAGQLNGTTDAFQAVHISAPKAVYEAMKPCATGVLISAVGIDANTKFSKYRRKGEETALEANIVVLRCGLVLGDTAYGGGALTRALAAFPVAIPVPAGPSQQFNPIHANDLATIVAETLKTPPNTNPLDVGGPETLGLRTLLGIYRNWLGLSKPRFLAIPPTIMNLFGILGDLCKMGPISRTSLAQLNSGVLANTETMSREIQHKPRPFSSFANARPAGTGDLWHARLYLLKPLLRLTLSLLWFVSGLIGLLLPADSFLPLLQTNTLSDASLTLLARLGGIIDLAIALALVRNWYPTRIARIQISMVLGYSLTFTILAPALWLLPLGGLLKNIPILVLLLFHLTLIRER